uniref:TOX high mobility group box family member 2 n=1 Tax=Heterorhabditis bacteriophora TaxID=37862 RepID=A0A1I7WPY6_HETBA
MSPALMRWSFSPLPPMFFSSEIEPQMSTPDDPVIHSPPSLGGQLMNGYNPTLTQTKMEESLGVTCTSPESGSIDPNGDVVCHSTFLQYIYIYIYIYSEFKCPYSEDCEINAKQTVGASLALNSYSVQELARQQAAVKAMTSPLTISPMEAQLGALNNRGVVPPLVSPPGQYPLMSPAGSGSSDSPPSRPLGIMTGGQRSPDAIFVRTHIIGFCQFVVFQYESNIMMQQRLRAQMPTSTITPGKVDPSRQVILIFSYSHLEVPYIYIYLILKQSPGSEMMASNSHGHLRSGLAGILVVQYYYMVVIRSIL